MITRGFPGGAVVKNLLPTQETQGFGFDPWVGNIPWRRKWQHNPVLSPGKSLGQRSLGVKRQTRLSRQSNNNSKLSLASPSKLLLLPMYLCLFLEEKKPIL